MWIVYGYYWEEDECGDFGLTQGMTLMQPAWYIFQHPAAYRSVWIIPGTIDPDK